MMVLNNLNNNWNNKKKLEEMENDLNKIPSNIPYMTDVNLSPKHDSLEVEFKQLGVAEINNAYVGKIRNGIYIIKYNPVKDVKGEDELPLEIQEEEFSTQPAYVPAPSIKDDREHLSDNGKGSILLIEDDINFAKILYKFCHEQDFNCIHAGDGESGLIFAQEYKPTAIILDLKLPGKDGWYVLDALKENSDTRRNG